MITYRHRNMAVRIRLTRTGKRNQPRYRIVAADSRAPRDGRFIEILGWYNPESDPKQIEYDQKRIDYWVQQGAQMSNRVRYLVTGEQTFKPKKDTGPTSEPDTEEPTS